MLLFFGIFIPLALAGLLLKTVWRKNRFVYEQPFMLWLHRNTDSAFLPAAAVLHHIGKTSVAAVLTILFAAWLYLRKRRGYAVFALLGTARYPPP